MYRIELYWTDMDGFNHVKGSFNIKDVINFVTHKEYLDIRAEVAFGNPPKLDVELIGFDGATITYIDVYIKEAVRLYNEYKNDRRVCVVLHPKENEKMNTETNWEHYQNEIFEAIKNMAHLDLSCAMRRWLSENGHDSCDDFSICSNCRMDMVKWFEKPYKQLEPLENGDGLNVGQYIRVSKFDNYDESFKVRFLAYSDGLFYVIPAHHVMMQSDCYDVYRYAWPCTV